MDVTGECGGPQVPEGTERGHRRAGPAGHPRVLGRAAVRLPDRQAARERVGRRPAGEAGHAVPRAALDRGPGPAGEPGGAVGGGTAAEVLLDHGARGGARWRTGRRCGRGRGTSWTRRWRGRAVTSIEEYLDALRAQLAGADPALVQDALYDAEEFLRAETAGAPADPAALADAIERYGTPEEVADGVSRDRAHRGRGAAASRAASSSARRSRGSSAWSPTRRRTRRCSTCSWRS